jgi:putative ABC transport system permease protein
MGWLKQILSRRKRYHELAESIREHLEEKIEDLMEEGLSREEATYKARREFGNVTLIEERSREVWQWTRLEALYQDLRFGVRMLLKKPGFALIVVITLALGIGANTAIFSVAHAVILNPFPYPDHSRIYYLYQNLPKINVQGYFGASGNGFYEIAQRKAFERVAAAEATLSRNLTGGLEPERITGARVSADFFPLLGVNPLLGRTIMAEDQGPRGERVLVINHSLWQRRFGGKPEVIGQKVFLDDEPYTLVGVMPPHFFFEDREAYIPFEFDLKNDSRRLYVVVRLKSGVSLEQANAELEVMARNQEKAYGSQYPMLIGRTVYLQSIREVLFGQINQVLTILIGAAGLVLLIACANIANLSLARGTGRTREIALRATLGADRFRIVRQLLTESMALALLGGTVGVLLAFIGVGAIVAMLPPNTIRGELGVSINGPVLFGAFIVSLISALLFGLWPALSLSKPDLNNALKEGGQTSAGLGHARARSMLVVFQVAISLVLLVTTGLMVRSLVRLLFVDPGFNPENVLTMRVNIPPASAGGGDRNMAVLQQLSERISTVPGVQSAGLATTMPFVESMTAPITAEGIGVQGAQTENVDHRTISTNYLQLMGIRLIEGEGFTAEDKQGAPSVVIVNQTMARRFWPNESAVGKRLKGGEANSAGPWRTVKGVVADSGQRSLSASINPEVYLPHLQDPTCCRRMNLVMRTKVEPISLIGPIRREIRSVNKNQPVYQVMTMEEAIAKSISTQRFVMTLMLIFAALALVLATVGVYGVISYSVAQCTHEFGIRIALGGQASDVLKLVVGHGMVLVSIGVLIGLCAAFALTRLAKHLLFGVSATDPLTFVLCSLLLTLVALLACWVPAHKATKVDPLIAIRCE